VGPDNTYHGGCTVEAGMIRWRARLQHWGPEQLTSGASSVEGTVVLRRDCVASLAARREGPKGNKAQRQNSR
jgi:hypothetical protein